MVLDRLFGDGFQCSVIPFLRFFQSGQGIQWMAQFVFSDLKPPNEECLHRSLKSPSFSFVIDEMTIKNIHSLFEASTKCFGMWFFYSLLCVMVRIL